MLFWDTSALVSLFIPEALSPTARALLAGDSRVCIWWGTPVEVAHALGRRKREGTLDEDAFRQVEGRVELFLANATVVRPTTPVRRRAEEIALAGRLRAGRSGRGGNRRLRPSSRRRRAGTRASDRPPLTAWGIVRA